MELMKRRFCFENNYQTGKFEETTLFAAERRIYVWIRRGPQLKKKKNTYKKKRRRKKMREWQKRLFIHIWIAGTFHMFRGLNVKGHLWKPSRRKSPMMRVTKNWQDKKQKSPLGLSGRNNGSLAQQIYTWVLKRQAGSKKPGKKEIASHGQSMS